MPDTLRAASLFLINTICNLYLFVLIIRTMLVWARANYFDPFTQFIVKLTDPIIKPLRRIIPNYRRIESASLIFMLLIEIIKFILIASLSFGSINIFGLIILASADLIKLFIQAYFYAILLQAILSWLQPNAMISQILYQFTSPIVRPFQRVIPNVGGFDLSPIPAMIVLQLLIILIVNPLMGIGLNVALNN
jgi:YggT family protein